MNIKQIYDKALAHGSYAIESEGQIALVDPGRDPKPYLDFANEHNGNIVAVFETHPHADFVSSHLEFQQEHGATIYVNPKVGVSYNHTPLDHLDEVKIGMATVRALFTPGHSPDHNSYLIIDEKGNETAVFTGDSLFVGDVGRPDLREGTGNLQVSKKELASMMFNTINTVFNDLEDGVVVYPAHGPGSLCGKNMSSDLHSTIGREKAQNWAFQLKEKERFVDSYLEGQSFIPKYFPFDVELNRKGVQSLEKGIIEVDIIDASNINSSAIIIDVRSQQDFKNGHLTGAINIQNSGENDKFETWLGSIVDSVEQFYLVADTKEALDRAILKTAKIGYENNIIGASVISGGQYQTPGLDIVDFKQNPDNFTIVDIRNASEVADAKFFKNAINIPLPELRERTNEVPSGKPVVVHCAGGYRSAAGSSILSKAVNVAVYDLSEAVNNFK